MQQQKDWKDFRKDALVVAEKENVTEHETFCLWVLYQLEFQGVENIHDYNKTILLAASCTEESPEFDEDENYVEYCLDTLTERGYIHVNDRMPFIQQAPNDIIKGGLAYVH